MYFLSHSRHVIIIVVLLVLAAPAAEFSADGIR